MPTSILFDIYLALFIDTGRTLVSNMMIAAAGRVIFIILFLIDRGTLFKGTNPTHARSKESWPLGPKGWAWFVAKEVMIILAGSLHVVLAVVVFGYGLVRGGTHAILAAKRSTKPPARVFGFMIGGFLGVVVPALGLAASAFMTVARTDANAPWYLAGTVIVIIVSLARLAAGLLLARGRESLVDDAVRLAKRALGHKVPGPVKIGLAAALVVLPAGMYLALDATVGISYTTELVKMPDDTLLATDVYLGKATQGPRPVILVRTPYNKGSLQSSSNRGLLEFVRQGYAVVHQDLRGRYASQGQFIPFLTDQADGAATVAWIKDQPWCDGNIASWGGSAGAINQYFFADEPTGALKFQTLLVGTPEFYDHAMFQGGAFRKSLAETWMYANARSNRPTRPGEYATAIDWLFTNPVKSTSWNTTSMSMNNRYTSVNSSAIHLGGWYDIFSQGTIDGYIGYNTLGGSGAAGKQRLVMGPYGHGRFGELSTFFNDASHLTFPDPSGVHAGWEAQMREAALRGASIDWSGPNVAYYVMGANQWFYADTWPVPSTTTAYYLNGSAGTFGTVLPSTNVNVSYLYDPVNPVPTRGGNNLVQVASLEPGAIGLFDPSENRTQQFVGIGPYDQQRAGTLNRSDVLVFSSNVLASPVTIAGRVRANLWIASNCTETAFTVMLLDQLPDGKSYNILDGILVTRARDGYNVTAGELVPGEAYHIDVDLWSTAYQFKPGHRIQVAISSSNFPRFERHPNHAAAPTNHPGGFLVANNTILTGGGYTSSIVLPVITL